MTDLLTNPLFAALAVVFGGLGLVGGGELLVRGATKIALGLRVSPLVVGLTIVALCTSAPEMAVSFSAALRGDPAIADVALGNVVGSNICNILLILGVCALIKPLATSSDILKRDLPVVIALSIATCLVARFCVDPDGASVLPQWFGFALLFVFVIYEFITIRSARTANPPTREESVELPEPGTKSEEPPKTIEKPQAARINWGLAFVQTILGLALLVVGARGFVDGAVSIARTFGVSELVIGLTLVALGTSLPELTVSAIATLRNQVDVAVGNVVGSNACNLMLVLGGTLAVLPAGLGVKPQTAHVDLPVMLAAVAIAAYFCLTGRKIGRLEGALLLLGQIGYSVYLVM